LKITLKNLVITFFLGIALVAVGSKMNHIAVDNNHGKMPVWVINEDVAASFIGDERHSPLTTDSQYKILCDVLVIPELQPTGLEYEEIASIGDIFIWLGRVLTALAQILFPLSLFLLLKDTLLRITIIVEYISRHETSGGKHENNHNATRDTETSRH
jgi:hypothetical protein